MNIHHLEWGKGRPVIFLHGFCETLDIWVDFVKPLAHNYRVIAPDLPGFGGSALPENVTIERIAQSLWNWCEKMKADNPVIIGHSLGGYVALAMAKLKPDALAGLVLFHSTALPDSEEKKENRKKTYDFVKKNGPTSFLEEFVSGLFFKKEPHLLEKYRQIAQQTSQETILKYTLAMCERQSYMAVVQEFNSPVLFLAGEQDNIIPMNTLDSQARIARQGTLAIVKEVGHVGMLENPQACLEPVVKFLQPFSE